jgi:PHD/YefM family antitoxin component YafN of YafNO toxin-antitoxin module
MAQKQINFIDLKEGTAFLLTTKGDIKPSSFKAKKALTAARISYNDIITHSFKLDKKYANSQELTLAVELKMYEDLALDLQKEYKIFYIEKETEVENIHLIEAFAYEKNELVKKYEDSFKKIKHLDYLAVPTLAFETLYSDPQMPKANDVFIYIGEDEAFLTFYKDGHYISSKKIKSLQEMLKELETKNLRPSLEELKEVIRTKGLSKENYTLFEYDMFEYITDYFEAIFSTIKNLSLHNRNIYNFATLDNVYIKFEDGIIPDLPLLAQRYLDESKLLPLNLYKEYSEYDFLDLLCAHYVALHSGKEAAGLNITFYKKHIPFYQTQSGRFMMAAAAGIVLAAIYPVWQQYEIYQLENENEILQDRLEVLEVRSHKLQKRYSGIKKEIAAYKKRQKSLDQKFAHLREIADTLLVLKSADEQYATMLAEINDLLHKYGLRVDKVTQSGEKRLDLELISKENKRDTIALFMQDLMRNGFSKVSSNEITLDDDTYKSIVTVKR